jgi:hypothetical protein
MKTTKSPKVGDLKKCDNCGDERAEYKRLEEKDQKERDRPDQPGDRHAWSCPACGFEDRVPS